MQPYDLVTQDDYDRQRPERAMPDFLIHEKEYLLRYIQSKNPEPFYATDYIVCIAGISKQGRFKKLRSNFTEISFIPVSPDRLPPGSKAVGRVEISSDGIIYSRNPITRPERGYFLDRVEEVYLGDLGYAQEQKPDVLLWS